MTNFPLQFNFVPYPIWRRKLPSIVKQAVAPIYRSLFPVDFDLHPPKSAEAMARYLRRFNLIPDALPRDIEDTLVEVAVTTAKEPLPEPKLPLRLPAQWEPLESVIVTFPVMYPPLWELHSAMIEAISQVANVEVAVPAPMWAKGAMHYLKRRGKARLERVKFMNLPTDDIWVRDYGPVVGYDAKGQRAVYEVAYDTHDTYPQERDDEMAHRFASYRGMAAKKLNLITEGGNLFSDGEGTLMMTPQVLHSNPNYTLESLQTYLHEIFDFEKLIMPPRLAFETTGHVDMAVKLANRNTVILSSPDTPTTAQTLKAARALFERETNARGEAYQIFTVPTPTIYFNWFFYEIRRSYTNSLTVNGRVLVPTYELPTDDAALRVYEQAMPGYEIIPINCKAGINGGGAVHCMTKEVPA